MDGLKAGPFTADFHQLGWATPMTPPFKITSLLHTEIANYPVDTRPSVPQQICHLDRSVAEWRDLWFLFDSLANLFKIGESLLILDNLRYIVRYI